MSPADLVRDKAGGWRGAAEYVKERFPAKFCFLFIYFFKELFTPFPKFGYFLRSCQERTRKIFPVPFERFAIFLVLYFLLLLSPAAPSSGRKRS